MAKKSQEPNALGEALTDPENNNKQGTAWVYAGNVVDQIGKHRISEIVSHEAGHLFGLSHIEKNQIMVANAGDGLLNRFSSQAADCLRRNVNGDNVTCDAGGGQKKKVSWLKGRFNYIVGQINAVKKIAFALPNSTSGAAAGFTLVQPQTFSDGTFGFDIPEFEGYGAFLASTYDGDEEYNLALDWHNLLGIADPFDQNALFDLAFNVGFDDLTTGSPLERDWVLMDESQSLRHFSSSTFSVQGDQPTSGGGGLIPPVPVPPSFMVFLSGFAMLFIFQIGSRRKIQSDFRSEFAAAS